ncbi:hypothetical protein BBK36DRAFT_1135045, partial [Trichoderma citrinoviride]
NILDRWRRGSTPMFAALGKATGPHQAARLRIASSSMPGALCFPRSGLATHMHWRALHAREGPCPDLSLHPAES